MVWSLTASSLTTQPLHTAAHTQANAGTQTTDNENTTIQNLLDAAKAVLRGKFIAIQAFLKKNKKNLK